MEKSIIDPFKKWWQFILTNLILGLLIAIFTTNNYSPTYLFYGILWSTTICLTQWLGHAWLQTKIAQHYSWIAYPRQRLILTFVSVTFYSIFAYAIVQILLNLVVFGTVPRYLYTINGYWVLPVLISLFVSTIIGAFGFFISWQKSILNQEQLKSEMLNYKYESLKNQINPHFMFNSLNVLSELVHDDQDLAVKFIHRFSDMYRYVLESKDYELRPLSDEIDFLKKYIFLLKIRFENKLEVNISFEAEEDQLIVPVALQLLVENAIKHNEVSNSQPLEIKIFKDGNLVKVENKIQPKISKEPSSQIGLKNLEQQYAFFNKEISIEVSSERFTVSVPILKSETE